MRKDKATKSIISKLIETASIQILNFVVGIVLARVLSPSDYGVYSVLLIFINIGQTVVVAGLNAAVIQRADIQEGDYSTVLTASLFASFVMYVILFASAPFIAKIYGSPGVVAPLRVISLVLFPDALYSVVNARIARRMEFTLAAKISIVTVVIAGTISILMALNSARIWALVAQQLLTYMILPILYCIHCRWFPKPGFKAKRFKLLFGFGAKILLADFVNAIYSNVQGMIIGFKYNSEALAFFNKGQMFPRTIMQTINGSFESVLFPVFSDMQNEKKSMGKILLENARMISFVVFPMMMGLFAVSNEIIDLLLTEKWTDCTRIVRIFCVAYMFWPIDSMNLQAIKACGDGNIYLKLNFSKKCIAAIILIASVFLSNTLEIFSLSAIWIYISDILLGSIAIKKKVGVSLFQELCALWRSAVCSGCIMVIMLLPRVNGSVLLTLACKIVLGVIIYILSSCIINRDVMKLLTKRVFRLKTQ